MSTDRRSSTARGQVGRYVIFDVLASGGMASVHLGRLDGAVGFSRVVAFKRLHPHLVSDPDFREIFRGFRGSSSLGALIQERVSLWRPSE